MEYGANLDANVDSIQPDVNSSDSIITSMPSDIQMQHNSSFSHHRPDSTKNPLVAEQVHPVVINSMPGAIGTQRNRDRVIREPKSKKNLV